MQRQIGWLFVVLLAVLASGLRWNAGYPLRASTPLTGFDFAPLQNIQQIAAGNSHTCALTGQPPVAGGVKCWGNNSLGQLGNGNTSRRGTPVDVSGLSNGVSTISTSAEHTCTLNTTGGVQCWGRNGHGQLGNNSTTTSKVPVDVVGLSNGVSAVSVGGYHTCALLDKGSVKCWGSNERGQLGNGSTTSSSVPIDVSGLSSGVIAIRTGNLHTCALTSTGIKCWGNNDYGQLGNNSTVNSSVPVDVSGLGSEVNTISLGDSHTCALTTAGGIKCWGFNGYGQLGNNSAISSSVPVEVSDLGNEVSAISLGTAHSCVRTTVGSVKCWGDNSYGQLGNSSMTSSSTPVEVSGLRSGVSAISAGGTHTCALLTAGGVKCWGYNRYGQLGSGSVATSDTPVEVIELGSGVNAIGTGSSHACALSTAGGVKCWGYNSYGQLGNNGTTNSNMPVDVTGLSSDVGKISVNGNHSCALTTAAGAKCWGDNSWGQLGNNSFTKSAVPVDVTDLSSGVSAISVGGIHTCALTTAGGVKCWGNNFVGQLGNNSTVNSSVPVDVSGLSSSISATSAGGLHTCVLTTMRGVKCWGVNVSGQLGNNSTVNSSVPVDVSGLTSGVSAISAGNEHTCVLTTAGGVKCWGNNSIGQLGNNSTVNSSVPVDVSGLTSGVSAISAGNGHTCVLIAAGGVRCWGYNDHGQLGDGSTTDRSVPVTVDSLGTGISAISTGYGYTCALTTVGGVKCWGDNGLGQLGDGNAWRTKPVDVVDPTAPTPTPTATSTATPTTSPGGDVYENDDTCAQARVILSDGGVHEHTFHQVSDSDWVHFAVTADKAYRIEVTVPEGSPADIDAEVYPDCASVPSQEWHASYTPGVRLDFTASTTSSFYLRLANFASAVAGAHVKYQLVVRTMEDAPTQRAVIIVAGRLKQNDKLQKNIHTVTDTVYHLFQRYGYNDDSIYYLATDSSLPGYDAAARKETLQAAITNWAASRTAHGVLNLYMIDHGKPDLFYIDEVSGQRVTPEELDGWLTQLEQAAPGVKINVIIEACQSGTFIAAPQSISKPGRVVITSSNAESDAKASKDGAYFSDHLLTWLNQGYNISASFYEARKVARTVFVFQDAWLDTNGNGISNEFEDSALAAQRGFAYTNTFADTSWAPHIFAADKPTTIADFKGVIQADVRDDEKVRQVWAVVYPPDYQAPRASEELLPEILPTFLLTPLNNGDLYAGEYPGFTQAGLYRVVLHAEDNNGLKARPVVIEVNAGSRLYLPVVVR